MLNRMAEESFSEIEDGTIESIQFELQGENKI
jgi:hypothetical protein